MVVTPSWKSRGVTWLRSFPLWSVVVIAAVAVVVVVVVVMVTSTAVSAADLSMSPLPSRGAKNVSVASFVKYLPEHFSLSVNGAAKCCLNLMSSIACIDFDFCLLFQHLESCPLWLLGPPLHFGQFFVGSNAWPPNKVCCPLIFCFFLWLDDWSWWVLSCRVKRLWLWGPMVDCDTFSCCCCGAATALATGLR